jgi:hypothetical protein
MTTHDYTNRGWGHDFAITKVVDGGRLIHMTGWGYGIRVGDYMILPNDGSETRYQVRTIEYETNPRDMWSGVFDFAPRPERSRQHEKQKKGNSK